MNIKIKFPFAVFWCCLILHATPTIPTLVQPTNDQTGVDLMPYFWWNTSTNASYYKVQVSKYNDGFTKMPYQYEKNPCYGTTHTAEANLTANIDYWWRVVAVDNMTNPITTAVSETRHFRTKNTAPGIPILSSPSNNAQNQNVNSRLYWNSASEQGATSYWIQISTSNTFAVPYFLIDEKNVYGNNYYPSGLSNNTLYYWRVKARNEVDETAFSSTWSFTTMPGAPTAPTWPNGTATTINSPFGPRNSESPSVGQSSWFHTGMDMGNGNTFVAPFNMKLVEKSVSTYLRLVFECTEPLYNQLRYVQFEELNVNTEASFVNNVTTCVRGQVVNATGNNPPTYVHMDCFPSGSWTPNNWTVNRITSKNPLAWWSYTQSSITVVDIKPKGIETSFPLESGTNKKYFDVLIRQSRPEFSLNSIKISLTDKSTPPGTNSDFLENAVAQEINLNSGVGVNREQYLEATQETNSSFLSFTGYAKLWPPPPVTAAVKIFAKDLSVNPRATDKDIVIRYYLKSNRNPTQVTVQAFDVFGVQRGAVTDWNFPGTGTGGGWNGPRPPMTLTATSFASGVRLSWTASPDGSNVKYYNIYRRPSNSQESPKTIGIVPASVLTYEDRTDAAGNTLEGGKTYLYSVASIGSTDEGCNGPPKSGCTGVGPNCPVSCVAEKSATVPSLPTDVVFEGKTVTTTILTVKAKNSVIVRQDQILGAGSVNFVAGNNIKVTPTVNVINGAQAVFKVDPAVK